MFTRSLATTIGLLLASALPALAQGQWVGKTVFIKGTQIIRMTGDGPGGKKVTVPLTKIHYSVLKEKGGLIQIHENGVDGWVGKGLFVPSEDAVAFYTGRIKSGGQTGPLYGYRAAAHMLAGNYEKALADLGEAVRLDPSQSVWWSNRVGLWMRQKEYDKAIADASQAIQINPRSAFAYSGRGIAHHAKRQYKQAVADFSESLRLDANSADVYGRRAIAWQGLKKYDEAIADFGAALRIHPKSVLDLESRGQLWVLKKDYDKALADFNAALKIKPGNPSVLERRARAWGGKKEYAKAIEDLSAAIEINPSASYAYNSLAWLLATCPSAEHRDGKRAVETATEACKLTDFKNGNSLDTLAAAYAEAGQFDEAVRYQEKALEDPDSKNNDGMRRRLELYKSKKAYRAE